MLCQIFPLDSGLMSPLKKIVSASGRILEDMSKTVKYRWRKHYCKLFVFIFHETYSEMYATI